MSLPLSFAPGRGFADFWVHAKNAELVHQLQRIPHAEPTSLFFSGRPSSGKTHLLEALCRETHEQGFRAGYIDLTEVKEMSTAVLDDLESLDLLCLDNMHTLNNSAYYHFQLAVFRLFNDYRAAGKSIIIASAFTVDELTDILPDLTSRFKWGLAYQLAGFAQNGTQEFLLWATRKRGMVMSAAAAEYILRYYRRDEAALINLLDRLEKMSLIEQRKLTIPFIRKVMQF